MTTPEYQNHLHADLFPSSLIQLLPSNAPVAWLLPNTFNQSTTAKMTKTRLFSEISLSRSLGQGMDFMGGMELDVGRKQTKSWSSRVNEATVTRASVEADLYPRATLPHFDRLPFNWSRCGSSSFCSQLCSE
jgi:hypothetical protein